MDQPDHEPCRAGHRAALVRVGFLSVVVAALIAAINGWAT